MSPGVFVLRSRFHFVHVFTVGAVSAFSMRPSYLVSLKLCNNDRPGRYTGVE
ncbi:hypothetical protein SAMN05892883_0148 [Jatrophihabitans sp. GAS493]|nr:hypothetical protein SAMN05892883_0148 [Jatrophihabitans sp. GAS493]